MKAHPGDWIIMHSHTGGGPLRKAEVITTGADGAPPYTVRWIEDDRESVVFPGPDAQVLTPEEQTELDRKRDGTDREVPIRFGRPAFPMTRRVRVAPFDLERLRPVIGEERQAALQASADAAEVALAGRVILHVNSTDTGGGVAEMLATLLGYSRGAGVDARWSVINGTPQFFAVTKRLHNLIHGHRDQGEPLGPKERSIYDDVLAIAGRGLSNSSPINTYRHGPNC